MKTQDRRYIRYIRYAVQLWFLLFCIYIGIRFYQFVLHFEKPGHPFVPRPPSVEGFLPIAGFVSFKYALFTGIIEPIHPAALVLFVAIVTVSLLTKKGFCGWICPIGTVSQYMWMVGEKIFGKNFRLKKEYDIPLRAIKYLVMAFFIVFIGIAMVPNMIVLFFITDYYKIVDVKTMKFFTEMSRTTMIVLGIIVVLSFLYKNFWCRYLCPYGALLGLVSKLSPIKIRRNNEHCIHCRSCSKHCPSLIDVEQKEVVTSAECFGCLTCISHCPSKDALSISLRKKLNLKPAYYIVTVLAVFYLFVAAGKLTGHWESKLPYSEYKRILSPASQEQTTHPSLSMNSHP